MSTNMEIAKSQLDQLITERLANALKGAVKRKAAQILTPSTSTKDGERWVVWSWWERREDWYLMGTVRVKPGQPVGEAIAKEFQIEKYVANRWHAEPLRFVDGRIVRLAKDQDKFRHEWAPKMAEAREKGIDRRYFKTSRVEGFLDDWYARVPVDHWPTVNRLVDDVTTRYQDWAVNARPACPRELGWCPQQTTMWAMLNADRLPTTGSLKETRKVLL